MSDRYLPFSSDDLERDMQDRQSCRVCGRTCSSTVGVCRSPVCTSALVERLEQQLAALREAALAEVARQRHQYAILRQELPPTTAALAALLQGEKG